MKFDRAIIVAFVFAVLAVPLYFFVQLAVHAHDETVHAQAVLDDIAFARALTPDTSVMYFRALADKKGAPYAFEVLRGTQDVMSNMVHAVGHVLGDALYTQQGIGGLSVCTNEFGSSCYHSMLANYTQEKGPSAVREINQMCIDMPEQRGDCQHALGHGIVATLGYDNIREALEVCESLPDQGPISSCATGAFMEYNNRTMEYPDGSYQRPLSDADLLSPCNQLSGNLQTSCYYEQVTLWRAKFGTENYTQMGLLCESIPEEENRRWCFRRMGMLVADRPEIGASQGRDSCSLIESETGRLYCLREVYEQFDHDPVICKNLSPENLALCTTPLPEYVIHDTQQLTDIAYARSLKPEESVPFFRSLAKEKGAVYAFEILRGAEDAVAEEAHTIGHVLGDILYTEKGIEGLSVCTTEFSSSCYHSMIANFVLEQGTLGVRDINQMCIDMAEGGGDCQHALGHGVLSSLGYDKLDESIKLCQNLADQGSLAGCLGGLFMEFNDETMLYPDATYHRPLTQQGLQYPCEAYSGQVENACYYEQASWWRSIFGQENYRDIGLQCESISHEGGRAWCYRRLGVVAADRPEVTPAEGKERCGQIVSESGELYCLREVYQLLDNNEAVCADLDAEKQGMCTTPLPGDLQSA